MPWLMTPICTDWSHARKPPAVAMLMNQLPTALSQWDAVLDSSSGLLGPAHPSGSSTE